MLALKIVHGMAREIAERVSYLRHECPHQCQPAKRVALRCFAELVLGTIEKLIAPKLKDNGSEYECSQEEKMFIKKLKLIRADIHAQLASVGCDIGDDQ
ncbi:hypothetical protein HKC75_004935 [Escherichia coli]|uniref:hypothetical protein n=1 Tax=Escherichia coli TaxID=562 RepID=UPI000B7DE367|nr:hypothetical protein [Escherichia coli]EFC1522420.1 hypothetical protein [Escherichia coli]EFG3097724.1 hypothetical protein [Escherichia coli]EFM9812076.1 hypothetical protein [Escherichia coli]EFU9563986.1 hypothetical protein [Escherichia coli]EGI4010878.1 hypothetical protein [Escherichia coli]